MKTVNWEDIKNANSQMAPIEVKGKMYMEVPQTIKAFRMLYPQGFIKNEMLSNENGVCIFRSTVGFYSEDGRENILGVGTAYEKENSSFINKTSYIENCETSACGRALGMAGFGIDVSVASAEEVQNAIINQTRDEKIRKVDITALKKKYPTAEQEKNIFTHFKITKWEDMTVAQMSELINKKEG
jgi:hypothetical protein